MRYIILCLAVLMAGGGAFAQGPTFDTQLFKERQKCVAYIEYFVQREEDRQSGEAVGVFTDDEGTIVCLPTAFAEWVPPERFRNIMVYSADNVAGKGFSATYLGQDEVNGWHYLRLENSSGMEYFRPITDFEQAEAKLGEPLWGIGITTGDLDYFPYFLSGRMSTRQRLPDWTGFTTESVVVPGGPVFNFEGKLIGWGKNPFPVERDMWIGSDYYRVSLRDPDESPTYLEARPFLDDLNRRIPDAPTGGDRAWLGVAGTQPIDEDTAKFMGLEAQGALVISEVIPESPADKAGIQDRDILLSLGGKPFPRLKPDSIVQRYFERELLLHSPGDTIELEVMRGRETVSLEVTLGKGPIKLKQARYHYFETPGFTVREFILGDAIQRRVDHREASGVVVSFVRSNSPAAAGELQPGDWVKKLDGKAVDSFSEAVSLLEEKVTPEQKDELVLFVRRGNETAVIRIKPENGG